MIMSFPYYKANIFVSILFMVCFNILKTTKYQLLIMSFLKVIFIIMLNIKMDGMKKLILVVIAMLAISIFSVSAQKIKITSGDFSALKGQKQISVHFTYNNLMVGKMNEADYLEKKKSDYNEKEAGKGDSFVVAWNNDRPTRYEPKFLELLNKYFAKQGVTADRDIVGCEFELVFNTYFIEPGWNIGISRSNAFISGTLELINTKTGKKLGEMNLIKAPGGQFGGYDFDSGVRISEAYAKTAKTVAGYLLKKKYI